MGTTLSNQDANARGTEIALGEGNANTAQLLANSQSRDTIGNNELGLASTEERKAKKVADVARRTVNELSEFADLINNLNATDNDHTQLSLNEGHLNLQDGLGATDSFNFGGKDEKRWLDKNFMQGLPAHPSTIDDKIDES